MDFVNLKRTSIYIRIDIRNNIISIHILVKITCI